MQRSSWEAANRRHHGADCIAEYASLAADIQTTSPLHITAIEKGSYDPKTQTLHRYEGPGIGCSLTRTMSLLSATWVNDAGKVIVPRVPVIPASTIAGKLRRAAADLIFESMVNRGMHLSTDAYNTMTTGMSSTDLKADAATPESTRAARQDPFLSLFGGTSFAMSAGSVICEGWPLLATTKDLLKSEPIGGLSAVNNLSDMTEAIAIVRKNDVASMTGKHLDGVIGLEKLAEYAQSESDSRVSSKKKKDAGEEGKKTDLRTLNAVEVVRTGMGFAIRIEVTSRSPAHLGLMLLALQEFLRSAQVGGKGARGLGAFKCDGSRLYEIDTASRKTKVLSTVFEDVASAYKFVDNDLIDEAVVAAQDYADAANPLFFEAFATADAKAIKKLQSKEQ